MTSPMTILLLSLVACSNLSPSGESAESIGVDPSDDPCAGAPALAADAQGEIDTLESKRDTVHFASAQLVDLQAMALRATNEPIDARDRAALDLQFGILLADLAEDAAVDPAIHPTALGLNAVSLSTSTNATAAYLALGAAIESLSLRQAGLQADVDVAAGDAESALAPLAQCSVAVTTTEREVVDAQPALDATRLENLEEGRELVAEAVQNTELAQGLVLRIRALAVGAARETIGDAQRGRLQQEFLGLTAELDRLADTSEYNGHLVASGRVESLGVTIGGDADEVIDVRLPDLRAFTLAVDSSAIDLSTASGACGAISGIDAGSAAVAQYRVELRVADDALAFAQERLTVD